MPETQTKPINSIYVVRIAQIEWRPCLGGESLQGVRENKALVEASTPEEAVEELKTWPDYYENWNKLPEEERKRITPFQLPDSGKEILFGGNLVKKVLFCERRFKNKHGEYTCGIPIHDIEGHPEKNWESTNTSGEFGMCCILGYDPAEDCPYNPNKEDIL